jgi:hypothetical protein
MQFLYAAKDAICNNCPFHGNQFMIPGDGCTGFSFTKIFYREVEKVKEKRGLRTKNFCDFFNFTVKMHLFFVNENCGAQETNN